MSHFKGLFTAIAPQTTLISLPVMVETGTTKPKCIYDAFNKFNLAS